MIVTPFAQVSSRVGHENEYLAQSDINRQLETLHHVVSDDHTFLGTWQFDSAPPIF